MKTVIGAGILSLPFTMSRLGYVMALLVFIFILVVNQITCIALLKAKNLSRHSNYTSISYHIFRSRVFQAIISIFVLFNNLGICMIGSYYKVLLSSRFSKKQCTNYWAIISMIRNYQINSICLKFSLCQYFLFYQLLLHQ